MSANTSIEITMMGPPMIFRQPPTDGIRGKKSKKSMNNFLSLSAQTVNNKIINGKTDNKIKPIPKKRLEAYVPK